MCLSKSTECTTPRVNPNVNNGLWVITCQCRFINYNKCTTLVRDFDGGGGWVEQGTCGNSVLSAQFFCTKLL